MCIGTLLFTVGFFVLFFNLYDSVYGPLWILTIGWYGMVTGFSLILYSRLHIVQANPKLIKGWFYHLRVTLVYITCVSLVFYHDMNIKLLLHKYVHYFCYVYVHVGILIMIGLNVIFNHFPTTVLTFGNFVVGTNPFVYGIKTMHILTH